MQWAELLFVVGWMLFLLIPAWTVKNPRPRQMLLFGIFFVLSFGGMVEGVLWLLGDEELYGLKALGPGAAPDLRSY